MAGDTVASRRFVHHHSLSRYFPGVHVTQPARYFSVRALQPVGGAGLVVERRRSPSESSMAAAALHFARGVGKLGAMNVLVAAGAGARRRVETDVAQTGLQILGFVAGVARHGPVRFFQRKRSGGVIKAGQILPRLGRVASLAAPRSLARSECRHARGELPLVGIRMADGAIAGLEMESGRRRFDGGETFVTIRAGNGDMRS